MGGDAAWAEATALWQQRVEQNPDFALRLMNANLEWTAAELAREVDLIGKVVAMAEEEVAAGTSADPGTSRPSKLPAVVESLRKSERSVYKIARRFRSVFWLDAAAAPLDDAHERRMRRPLEQIDERSLAYGSASRGAESAIKCPSPLNVLKDTYDRSCW
jgi:hypothetical protein